MKLFAQTVAAYVIHQVEDALLGSQQAARELRIFTQSMPPDVALQMLRSIADRMRALGPNLRLEARIAAELFHHWQGGEHRGSPILSQLVAADWVDTEDRLTYYRNLASEPTDRLLLVLLVGIDHATDRGGLADFHILTEEAIYRDLLNGRYETWVRQVLAEAGLSVTSAKVLSDFEELLQEIFSLRPRSLVALSQFFSDILVPKAIANGCDDPSEVLALAYENLHFWGLPPLYSPENPAKRLKLLKAASRFFTRDAYRDARERRVAQERLTNARETLESPPFTEGGTVYADVDDFLDTLEVFVEEGDEAAKQRLLRTDFAPVTEVLERERNNKTPKPKPSKSPRLQGAGLQVVVEAVFETLKEFAAGCGRDWPPGQLKRIEVELESFEFDGAQEDVNAADATALGVFRGLVGGIDAFLGQLLLTFDAASSTDPAPLIEVPLHCALEGVDGNPTVVSRRLKESRLRFRVRAVAANDDLTVKKSFVWAIPPHHEERVRFTCALLMHRALADFALSLPSVHLGSVLDELFFAIDEGEAHRLLASGLSQARFEDVLKGLDLQVIERETVDALHELAGAYRAFVRSMVEQGYFAATQVPLHALVTRYKAAVDAALRRDAQHRPLGADLLRRLYQAFVGVPEGTSPSSAFLPAIAVLGISPAIAETTQARDVFVRDGFIQVARTLLQQGSRQGRAALARLFGLVEIRRPLYGLVFDSSRRITTNLKSFGLLHRLGERPAVAPTLSAQAEMRADDTGEGDTLSEFLRESPESRVLQRTLRDYRQIHPYAGDRIGVLAANVEDLRPLIAGVDSYLRQETLDCPACSVPYLATIAIIGRGPAPTAAEAMLRQWQERWAAREDLMRPCRLIVSYRSARRREEILSLLEQTEAQFDVAFLFSFLNDQSGGDNIVPTTAFQVDWRRGNVGKFPVCEHPRPASPNDPHLRQGLVSNRRFQVAARHSELTARLHAPEHPGDHHLVFNQVEYGDLERKLTRRLHRVSRWVACMDRFVDKSLILEGDANIADRKLVGFTSGVGAYGEFNLTLSTESSTARELLDGTIRRLRQIYREWSASECDLAARRLVEEAQSVTGLSLVRALGSEGVMRDVIGYAIANRLYLGPSLATLKAAVPLDSFPHWFDGADDGLVPDLLLLEATLQGQRFSVDATIVECKVGQQSSQHEEEAVTQAGSGLLHLSRRFLPNVEAEFTEEFDRRFWWAQLHRALVVRNSQAIQAAQERDVDRALERLADGDFDIHWRAVGATFWTNDNYDRHEGVSLSQIRVVGQLPPPVSIPLEVYHAAVGHRAVLAALTEDNVDLRSRIRPVPAATCESAPHGSQSTIGEEDPTQRNDGPPSASNPPPIIPTRPDPSAQAALSDTNPPALPSATVTVQATDLKASERPGPNPPTTSAREEPTPKSDESTPSRILLGAEVTTHGNAGDAVYWEYGHDELANRHILLFGGSGTGKTYAIQALLLEMGRAGRASVVIDYTDGFLPRQLEPELLRVTPPKSYVLVAGTKLPIDPFQTQVDEIEGIGSIQETAFDVAKRVASIFTAVYSTLGEQQQATLVRTIETGLIESSLTLQRLYEQLNEAGEDLLANKIMPLARTEPFTEATGDAWTPIFSGDEALVSILQLTRVATDVQRLIIEFVLWDLWNYMRRSGHKSRPLPVVLDEVQNLDHRAGSPLEKYLREGRKFGASMILATQTLSNFGKDERDRLFQAGHKLFFSPAATELRGFATILKDVAPSSSVDEWSKQLASLKKGECLSVGMERRPNGGLRQAIRKIRITSLTDRSRSAR